MYSILSLYICENKIYKMLKPKKFMFKAISDLSNKEVLLVEYVQFLK